jgi:hypothetical protein
MPVTANKHTEPAEVVPIVQGKLEKFAQEINDQWHDAHRASIPARIEIGKMLLKAKDLIETRNRAGNAWIKISWTKWCAHNIEKSMSDINKVIALAEHPDPLGALEEERAKRREAMRLLKERTQPAAAKGKDGASTTASDAQVGAEGSGEGSSDEQ